MIVYAREICKNVDFSHNFAVSRLSDFSKYEIIKIDRIDILTSDVKELVLEKAVQALKCTANDITLELLEPFV